LNHFDEREFHAFGRRRRGFAVLGVCIFPYPLRLAKPQKGVLPTHHREGRLEVNTDGFLDFNSDSGRVFCFFHLTSSTANKICPPAGMATDFLVLSSIVGPLGDVAKSPTQISPFTGRSLTIQLEWKLRRMHSKNMTENQTVYSR
jgi:hypothetical protein